MDNIFLFLFLITILLSIYTIFNNKVEQVEQFESNENNSEKHCFTIDNTEYKTMTTYKFIYNDPKSNKAKMNICSNSINSLIQIDKDKKDRNLDDNYTISLIFKIINEETDNKIYHLISLKNKWIVGIQKGILFFMDTDNKTEPKLVSLNSNNNESEYNHLAIISSKQEDNTYKYELFVNGNKGFIVIPNNTNQTLDDIHLAITPLLSISNFNGYITEVKYENKVIKETELCSRWNSCGVYSCPYDESKSKNPSDCMSSCKLVKGCSESDCKNKCYNLNTSTWDKCSYIPEGNTKNTCVDRCLNTCEYDECVEKCNNCKDKVKCDWLNYDTNNRYTKYINENQYDINTLEEKTILPPLLKIENINNIIYISWEHPFSIYNNEIIKNSYDREIEMFIFIINKVNKKNEGNEMFTIQASKKIQDYYDSKKIYTIDIKKLEKGVEYSVIAKSIKKNNDNRSPSTSTPTDDKIISDNSYIYYFTY